MAFLWRAVLSSGACGIHRHQAALRHASLQLRNDMSAKATFLHVAIDVAIVGRWRASLVRFFWRGLAGILRLGWRIIEARLSCRERHRRGGMLFCASRRPLAAGTVRWARCMLQLSSQTDIVCCNGNTGGRIRGICRKEMAQHGFFFFTHRQLKHCRHQAWRRKRPYAYGCWLIINIISIIIIGLGRAGDSFAVTATTCVTVSRRQAAKESSRSAPTSACRVGFDRSSARAAR